MEELVLSYQSLFYQSPARSNASGFYFVALIRLSVTLRGGVDGKTRADATIAAQSRQFRDSFD